MLIVVESSVSCSSFGVNKTVVFLTESFTNPFDFIPSDAVVENGKLFKGVGGIS